MEEKKFQTNCPSLIYFVFFRTYYSAELESVDYANAEEARQKINNWVEGQTANKIQNLIPSGVLNALVRLVLVNAIYFKGDWVQKFDPKNTEKADFHVSAADKVTVDMMFQSKKFRVGYSRDLKTSVVEMPYIGDDLSMVVLLPDKQSSIEQLEQGLTLSHLINLQTSFRMSETNSLVWLPKFKMEQDFDLSDILSDMGMSHLFSDTNADLSGVDGQRNLYLSKVLHKAFIEVNEEGSEAAAATAGIMMLRAAPRKMMFKADRPFLFFIQDTKAGTILFLGKMVAPEAAVAKDEH